MYYVSHLLSLPCGLPPLAYIGGILPDFMHLRGERLSDIQIRRIMCIPMRKGIIHHIAIDKEFHVSKLPAFEQKLRNLWYERHGSYPERRYFFFHLLAEVLIDLLLLELAYYEVARRLASINVDHLNRSKRVLLSVGVSLKNVINLCVFMRKRLILRLSLDFVKFILRRRKQMWGALPPQWEQTIITAKHVLKGDVKNFYEWLHDYGCWLWHHMDYY